MKKDKKPLIGLMPKDIWWKNKHQERFNQIEDAILRYLKDGSIVPNEWFIEYMDLKEIIVTGDED